MPPPVPPRGRAETPEAEQHQVHNCFVVMADMTGLVPEAASNLGASPSASRRSGSRVLHDLQGLGSGSPFSMLEGMNPFVFGTFIQPQQESGLGGVAPSSQSGEQSSAVPSSFPSISMGQSLLFRMGPPTSSSSTAGVTASNRRSASTSSTESQRSRLRQRLQDVSPYPLGRSTAGRDRDRGLLSSFLNAAGQAGLPNSGLGSRQTSNQAPTSSTGEPSARQPRASAVGDDGPRAPPGPEAGTNSVPESVLSPLDQIFQRVSHISAEAFITDFVRQAIEAGQRSRGNPPASQFGIDHLKETTLNELSCEACTVCQDVLEKGSVVLTMPCGHYFHKSCLMPWLAEHNTCPVCRCEIESHCPRYNQQNFIKLKGELDAETIIRQKNGDPPPGLDNTRVQTRFFSASDLHSETSTSVSADGGSRSLRMTLRMPVGALSELVSRLSSATSHDVQISTHPFSPQAVVQPASLPNANAPPSARQDSTSHAASVATSEAVRPSHFEHNFGILRPSVSIRRHLHQPPLPATPQLAVQVPEAGTAVESKDTAPAAHTSRDLGSTSRRQTACSHRRQKSNPQSSADCDTVLTDVARLTGAEALQRPEREKRGAAKRQRTGGPGCVDAIAGAQRAFSMKERASTEHMQEQCSPGAHHAAATVPADADAPVSSRTRKRN